MCARRRESDTYKWYLQRNQLESFLCLRCLRVLELPQESDEVPAAGQGNKLRCCREPVWGKVITPSWDGDAQEDRWITLAVRRCRYCKQLGTGFGSCTHCNSNRGATGEDLWESGTKSFRLGNSFYSRFLRFVDTKRKYRLWLQWPKGRAILAAK